MSIRNAGIVLVILMLTTALSASATELVKDGKFNKCENGDALRMDSKGLDWYESRHDTDAGRGQLKMSTKNIHGNKTKKAVILADPELNTYLSWRFKKAQTTSLTAQYDILVKEILPDDNRSAFMFLGRISDKKGGPNSTGRERFAFLGFENAKEEGKINLFVREGSTKWNEKTIVAENMDLNTWYTIKVEANIPEGWYAVSVDGVVDYFEVESFYTKGKTPNKISHISFASWNDGAGTFYIDNVSVLDQ